MKTEDIIGKLVLTGSAPQHYAIETGDATVLLGPIGNCPQVDPALVGKTVRQYAEVDGNGKTKTFVVEAE